MRIETAYQDKTPQQSQVDTLPPGGQSAPTQQKNPSPVNSGEQPPASFKATGDEVPAKQVIDVELQNNPHNRERMDALTTQAQSKEGFAGFVKQTFGVSDTQRVEALRQDILAGDWRWAPQVQRGEAQGFSGAYMPTTGGTQDQGSGKILLDNGLHGEHLAKTTWEELGHAMDFRLRAGEGDARGDEGQVFSARLAGEPIPQSALTENDHGAVETGSGTIQDVEFGGKQLKKMGTVGAHGDVTAVPTTRFGSKAPAYNQGVVLSGHGQYKPGEGYFRVPEGTTITFYSPHGSTMSNALGNAIESGNINLQKVSHWTYKPGDLVKDYTLSAPHGLEIAKNGTQTTIQQTANPQGESLSALAQKNKGSNIHWAACAEDKTPGQPGTGLKATYDPKTGTSALGNRAEVERSEFREGFNNHLSTEFSKEKLNTLFANHETSVRKIVAGGRAAGADAKVIHTAVNAENNAFLKTLGDRIGAGASKGISAATEFAGPALDGYAIGQGLWKDMQAGDGKYPETLKAMGGVGASWAGAEIGASLGAVGGPVGALAGGLVGGVVGYTAGEQGVAWVENAMGYGHEGHEAPIVKASIPQTTEATGYAVNGLNDLATVSDPAVYDTQAAQKLEADAYAKDLQGWLDESDSGPNDDDFDNWFNINIGSDEAKAKRLFTAMHDLNPNFGDWMSAKHTRFATKPFAEYTKWAMKYADGGTGTGNIVNAAKHFGEVRSQSELDLAYDVFLGNNGLGTTDPIARERFYDKATAMYGPAAWAAGPKGGIGLNLGIANAGWERQKLWAEKNLEILNHQYPLA